MKFKSKNNTNSSNRELISKIKPLWEKREKEILYDINQVTGLSIGTEKIICYIDNSTSHGYYGGRTITLGVKGGISEDDALMVISHELFHIFYWRKIKKMKLTTSAPGTESKKEWKLAEVAAFLLTDEPSIKENWINAKVYLYPEIKDIYKKVKKFWKKGDIEYFLINSYKIINK